MSEGERRVMNGEDEVGVLTSWKEIATHLQVSVKTAQRYEAEMGLPVKRLAGRVSISMAELNAWRETAVKVAPWWTQVRKLQIALGICVGLLAAGAAGAAWHWMSQLPGAPASATMEGRLLRTFDKKGRPVWEHQFDVATLVPGATWETPEVFEDIDGDGKVETVAVWPHVKRDENGWSLHCFSEKGAILWELKMDDRVRVASGKELGPPYVLRSFALFDSPEGDGTRWAAATFAHVNDVVSTLAVVDSKGKRRGQYWHSGHLNSVRMFDADGDGKPEIVTGGVRHGRDQAVIVAFHPGRVSGANAMPEGDKRAIAGQGPSSEIRAAFLPLSELSREMKSFNFISRLMLAGGHLHAHVYESVQMPEAYLIYDFAPGLKLADITITPAFAEGNRKLAIRKQMEQFIPERELARLRAEYDAGGRR